MVKQRGLGGFPHERLLNPKGELPTLAIWAYYRVAITIISCIVLEINKAVLVVTELVEVKDGALNPIFR
ncbi:hypothetical protein [Scytonema sp. PRP1]|uniref:hypothetical protein n=1 Tax=Scytonema sp. PRP1 TaxID=3120513 RepID=UPI000BBBA790